MDINLDKHPRTKNFLIENNMTIDEAYAYLKREREIDEKSKGF
jgi:hypothetical protein